jgi:hypothetical protein
MMKSYTNDDNCPLCRSQRAFLQHPKSPHPSVPSYSSMTARSTQDRTQCRIAPISRSTWIWKPCFVISLSIIFTICRSIHVSGCALTLGGCTKLEFAERKKPNFAPGRIPYLQMREETQPILQVSYPMALPRCIT